MTSGPIVALCLGKEDAIRGWRSLMGPTNALMAKEENPKSLRAIFGTDGRRNATHGSDSPDSAYREIKFFFPEVTVEPVMPSSQARAYMNEKLNPTLLRGLTALAAERPTSNPYQAILWLSDWLLSHNPNKPRVLAKEEFPIDPEREDDERPFADAIQARYLADQTREAILHATGRPARDATADLLPVVPLQDGPASDAPPPAVAAEESASEYVEEATAATPEERDPDPEAEETFGGEEEEAGALAEAEGEGDAAAALAAAEEPGEEAEEPEPAVEEAEAAESAEPEPENVGEAEPEAEENFGCQEEEAGALAAEEGDGDAAAEESEAADEEGEGAAEMEAATEDPEEAPQGSTE